MTTPAGETKKKNAEESPTKKWLRRFIKIAIVLIVAAFLFLTVRRSIAELRGKEEFLSVLADRWPWLVIALFVSIVAMFPAAIAWYQALRSFRQTAPCLPALDAYFLGHLGKYVPGKAMVIIMRVGRLQPLGVGLRPAIVSVFVETLTMLCAGAVLGALLLVLLEVPVWLKVTALACVPIGLLFLTPHFFRIGLKQNWSDAAGNSKSVYGMVYDPHDGMDVIGLDPPRDRGMVSDARSDRSAIVDDMECLVIHYGCRLLGGRCRVLFDATKWSSRSRVGDHMALDAAR
jgi:hypothetical protein